MKLPRHLLLHLSLCCLLLPVAGKASAQRTITGRTEPLTSPLTLWYRQPAAVWTDALAIGNGRFGAMVFARPENDLYQLNDITVWSGGPLPNADRAGAYKHLPAIREALAKGDYATAQTLEQQYMTTDGHGDSDYFPSYQTLGDLRFAHHLDPGDITGYLRTLDLDTAVTTCTFTLNGVHYKRESFASHPSHAIVSRISADRPGKISFSVSLTRAVSATTHATGNDTLTMRGVTTYQGHPGNLDFEAQLRILHSGGTITSSGDTLTVTGADEATLYVTAGTSYVLDPAANYKGPDPHELVTRQLAIVSTQPFHELETIHTADYQSLFRRVSFGLPSTPASLEETDRRLVRYGDGAADPSLATLYYQMGRYLLIASSRADNPLPSNAQGIWGDGFDLPWKSDYKSNINYQMNYWPSETANLSELHLPAIRFDASLVPSGTRTAQAYYYAPGWVVAYTANAWGWTAPGAYLPWGPFFAGGGWIMQDLWEHYAFTRDTVYLQQVYPVLRGSAEFYLSILVPDAAGKLITSPSVSPENTFRTDGGVVAAVVDGSAVEREIIWDLFTNTIAASQVLHTDDAFRAKLIAAKARIRPLEIGKAGQLEEWGHDWDLNAPEMNHRHVSHLFAAYPGWQISPATTPALADAVRKSLALRGDEATGWSNAWKINLYARLNDGDHAARILAEQLRLAATKSTDYHGHGGGTYANMFDAHPPFQIDGNFGGTSGMDEMLLQSDQRYSTGGVEDSYLLNLLPALPALWPSGSITGLRARGGFAVDLTWANGALAHATIRSVRGTTAHIAYKDQMLPLSLSPGQQLEVTLQAGKLTLSQPARTATNTNEPSR